MEGVGGVVNYEAPHQFKTYLHRVGRTARAGERGVAYTLLAPEEVRYTCWLSGRLEGCVHADHMTVTTSNTITRKIEQTWKHDDAFLTVSLVVAGIAYLKMESKGK